jgi:hypothetical protein
MTFRRDDGSTDCYAHWEYSAINPATALKHYRGVDYSPKKGERMLEEKLPEGSLVKLPPKPAQAKSDGTPTAAASVSDEGSGADATSVETSGDADATAAAGS